MFGFRGIVVQHCLDHIDGKLVIDEEVSFGRVKIEMEVQQYFKKTAFLLREYALRLQLHKETQNNSVSTANT